MIGAWGRLVAGRPRLVASLIVVVALGVGTGVTRTEPAPDLVEALVPDRTDLADALNRIDERFADSLRTTTAQIIVRGSVVDPEVMAAFDREVAAIAGDPFVSPFVNGPDSIVVHSSVIASEAGAALEDLTREEVDGVLAAIVEGDLLGDLIVRGPDGEIEAAVGWIELRRNAGTSDDVLRAERRIGARLEAVDLGPATARALTNAAFEDATDEAMDDSVVLFPLAIVMLVIVLYVSYRSASDVLATFAGMVLVTIFTLGAEGWLGPGGLGLLGGATAIGVVIPVLLVGLTVDYALQVTSAYRGFLSERATPVESVAGAVGTAGGAVALGAATTALSFLTNLASPLGPIRDFGILAAVGIVAGFVIMTGFVPAVRAITDPKRGRFNRALLRGELMSGLAVVPTILRRVVEVSTKRPLVVVVAAAAVGAASGLLALGVDVRFETEDFLPEDSDFIVDIRFLEEEVGGADSTVTAVVVGDRGDPEVMDSIAFVDGALTAEDGPEWITGPAEVLVDESGGDDTTLFIVPVRLGDIDERREAMDWFDEVWRSPAGRLTLTGELVLPVIVADSVARGQLISTGVALIAALVVLTTYFSRVHSRGLLGVVVLGPIVFVMGLVVASMRLLDIPYNALTATLAALTIGIGVDYTIHVVHRYLAERQAGASPPVAMQRVSTSTGGALLISAVTTAVGFGVLVAAPLPAVGQLGFLTALTVALSFLVSLIVLPALVILAEKDPLVSPAATRTGSRTESPLPT